jgi:hypothetical protein
MFSQLQYIYSCAFMKIFQAAGEACVHQNIEFVEFLSFLSVCFAYCRSGSTDFVYKEL